HWETASRHLPRLSRPHISKWPGLQARSASLSFGALRDLAQGTLQGRDEAEGNTRSRRNDGPYIDSGCSKSAYVGCSSADAGHVDRPNFTKALVRRKSIRLERIGMLCLRFSPRFQRRNKSGKQVTAYLLQCARRMSRESAPQSE